jgi:hypothetical protein
MPPMLPQIWSIWRKTLWGLRGDLAFVEKQIRIRWTLLKIPKWRWQRWGFPFLEQGGLPSKEQQATLQRALQQTYDMSEADAAEALILGRWLMSQCGGPDPAVARISRKLRKLAGLESLQPLMSVLQAVASKNQDGLQARQTDALGTIARSFKLG